MKKSTFEKQKTASLAHQLIKAGRLVNVLGLDATRDTFRLPELKQSHLDLFPHIDFEGTRISEIAKRKGVSKQAVSKWVQEMVSMNLLFLEADPQDSRSKIVFFKTSGPFAIQKGFEALVSIDHLLMDHLGEKSYATILKKISALVEKLQPDATVTAASG